MDLDLHLHCTASDGTATPGEVVEAALRAGLDVIALTDHDTVAGVPAARKAVAGRPLEVIAALEVSTTGDGTELHILGYFVDLENPALRRYEKVAGTRREARMMEMVGRLEDQGVEVSFESVLAAAGAERGNLGRPHLARALVKTGHATTVSEAFDRYIGNSHPAYVPASLLSPEEGIDLILGAGGVPVWAHPWEEDLDRLLPGLVEAGLMGLEVYRPRTPRDRVLRLERRARDAGLVVSGGSDWHGPDDGELGEFRVTGQEVAALLEAGGL